MTGSSILHSLVKFEYQPNSYEPYRYYCECTCGFACRMGTEAASKSQFDNHLKAHNTEPYFANLATEEVKEEEEKPKWDPFEKK
jgi:hypothetical protein